MTSYTAITDAAQLTALVGEPAERARNKVRAVLDEHDRRWLAASSFCVISTSDAEGRCDASPKGDPAGSLVHVIDEHSIAIAERPGNRRVDGYHNVLANPHCGIVFIVPGRSDTLRINGTARLVRDADWFDDLRVRDQRPILALVVDVQEVFGHCAKSLIRGQVWHPETWHPESVTEVSATARERRGQGEEVDLGGSISEVEERQLASYGVGLY